MAGPHPAECDRWEGRFSKRDADEAEAARVLTRTRIPWPRPRTLIGASPYRTRFRQGATIVPRRFFIVDPAPASRLGRSVHAPIMQGRAGRLDKKPWTTVEPPRGPVEAEFLRQLVMGESIAPFRMLETLTAIIPLDGGIVLDAAAARAAGKNHLATWLKEIEAKWDQHSNRGDNGEARMPLSGRLDHMRKLSSQSGQARDVVIYGGSGTLLSAAYVPQCEAIIEHGAYWAKVRSRSEGAYLSAILNSAVALAKIVDLQPHGQRDKRHFDNLVWTLPIPEYDDTEQLHRDLAAAAARAEAIAATVQLTETQHFTAKRRTIRAALTETGIAAEIETLVDALLPP